MTTEAAVRLSEHVAQLGEGDSAATVQDCQHAEAHTLMDDLLQARLGLNLVHKDLSNLAYFQY